MDDLIGGMFNIPEQKIVEQLEEKFGDADSGKKDKAPEDAWDPFAGW